MVLVGAGISRVLCHILGYFYPAYQTFKAVQGNDETIYTQWLTYWIVNTYFTVFELIADNLLSNWFPLYYETKVALLLWLVTPQFMGASKIYKGLLAPYMIQYETDIDSRVAKFQEDSAEQIGKIGRVGLKKIQEGGVEVVRMGVKQIVQMQTTAMLEELGVENVGGGGEMDMDERNVTTRAARRGGRPRPSMDHTSPADDDEEDDEIHAEIDYEDLYNQADATSVISSVDSDSDY